ncbi:SpoIIE-like protein phosphatase domain protein [Leptospira broomii serovar Hurstbridge str. 5399]|uniref:SpoIIE-like protein phosphatase domain protein n=1 Tax=Leptospira broomii serovar Hurstbridge str. 5399 TaxID=1049789 RepID=T0FAR6_9LEPT|nr:SpoIIE family protein phosphatase [Leptospira broomii]EQA44981.1 SpoIIE-like protein phosphatase domain protein [Leptospira broomii serovar Hurstbridge str. 5399]
MEDKKELLTDRIASSGPVTINRIRFGLVVLFLGSLAASWAQSSLLQNAAYLLGTCTLAGFAIANLFYLRRNGTIPVRLGMASILADVITLGITMFVASWTDRDMSSGVIRQLVLYAINMIFIVYSGLLLSPNFVLWTGFLCAFCQGIVILNSGLMGVEFTEDEIKVLSPGYASISEQALKLVFLVVVAYITKSVIVIFRLIGAVEEEYANTLEEKVKERTREVTGKMDEIQALKIQQDGDYYLTSLLSKPLTTNWNTSIEVSTTFYIEQKKKFIFKNRESELGGDICISGNLLFGSNKEKWIVFLNGDAMGKSLQGAGGAIVLGTAVNNIMARSASHGRVLEMKPEDWIHQTYRELDDIFRTFDGMMMASVILGLINEKTGRILFFNAEHPWPVLYRDGRASFLVRETSTWKLGSPIDGKFKIQESKLMDGDVIYIGSDGRDDISLSEDGIHWRMNEDETIFLRIVEEAKGEIDGIADRLHSFGVISDDLSLMRIGFKEQISTDHPKYSQAISKYSEARRSLQQRETVKAVSLLKEAWTIAPTFKEPARLLGQVYYDRKDYVNAIKWFEKYLSLNSNSQNIWFVVSLCYKHIKDFKKAAEAAEAVRISQPHRFANLINLADNYRLLGDFEKSRDILQRAKEISEDNALVEKLEELLDGKGH